VLQIESLPCCRNREPLRAVTIPPYPHMRVSVERALSACGVAVACRHVPCRGPGAVGAECRAAPAREGPPGRAVGTRSRAGRPWPRQSGSPSQGSLWPWRSPPGLGPCPRYCHNLAWPLPQVLPNSCLGLLPQVLLHSNQGVGCSTPWASLTA